MRIIKKCGLILFLNLALNSFGQNQPDAALTKKVEKAILSLKVKDPSVSDPVSVDSQLIWNSSKTQFAVVVKSKVLAGWHIYAYVPKTQPYLQYKLVLETPKGVTPLTDWTKPNSYPYADNIFVYKGQQVFTRYFSVKDLASGSKITTGLFYQTCDIRQCLPPKTKAKELKL
ncbi:protein-disulfide reductase DsbD domain-containing protein [Flavobacterium agrisoli]|uniref:Thiol:disulfide interchange protein DsbD N-terminal domain-containing protein n=1 Tax=Flavobacterium agrisoli TaxID=2793066 RepID=A0A934PIF7_9FLAO|nr:protein-disulfide reductase DsbD domain-containing protein [Flavobacterium agrisoli]MBK0368696.1 hypothetical protein [Flavobacterium agrisoli]